MHRKVIKHDGSIVLRTLTNGRNIRGPREWLEARERRFRLDGCPHYLGCVLAAAQARWDGFTCRGCRDSRGAWFQYIQANGTAYRTRRPVQTCSRHGVPLAWTKPSGKPRSRPACPVCCAEASERQRQRWQRPEEHERQARRMQAYWATYRARRDGVPHSSLEARP